MIKAVLDTSVIVSAVLIKASTPHNILKAWTNRKFELVTSPQILAEMGRVLSYPKIKKKRWMTDKEAKRLLASLAKHSVLAGGKLNLKVIQHDPGDDKFIIAAIERKADYIVSGDSHLRNLKMYKGIRIISPAEFWELIVTHGIEA